MATDLEARLELLEAERAITRTLHRYAHSIDYGDEEGWVDCFTEDGVFDVRSRHAHQLKRLITGREELRAFIARHTRAPELWHKHLLIEPVIDVDGDTATCVSYLAVVMEHEDVPVIRVFGRYRDRLRSRRRRPLALPRADRRDRVDARRPAAVRRRAARPGVTRRRARLDLSASPS